jgi:hypothetical protein
MTNDEIKIHQNEILCNLMLAASKGKLTLDMVNDGLREIFGFVPFAHERAAHRAARGQGKIKADQEDRSSALIKL